MPLKAHGPQSIHSGTSSFGGLQRKGGGQFLPLLLLKAAGKVATGAIMSRQVVLHVSKIMWYEFGHLKKVQSGVIWCDQVQFVRNQVSSGVIW